jgi:hypothetical protein
LQAVAEKTAGRRFPPQINQENNSAIQQAFEVLELAKLRDKRER